MLRPTIEKLLGPKAAVFYAVIGALATLYQTLQPALGLPVVPEVVTQLLAVLGVTGAAVAASPLGDGKGAADAAKPAGDAVRDALNARRK